MVRTDCVVFPDVFCNGVAKPRRAVLVDIDLCLLQTAEPALHYDIVGPALPSVHALRNIVFLQEVSVLGVGKLTALVAVENRGSTVPFHGVSYSLQNVIGSKLIHQLPANDLSAVSVNDGSQIHVVTVHFDVGDIDGPVLIEVDLRFCSREGMAQSPSCRRFYQIRLGG